MTRQVHHRCLAAVGLVFLTAVGAPAQSGPVRAAPTQRATAPQVATGPGVAQPPQPWGQDAQKTREDFIGLLQRCPPALAKVLKLDPSLMANQAYLAAYPEVGAFLAAHAEVARDPHYFLESISVPGEYRGLTPQEEALSLWRNMMEGTAMFLVFLVLTGAVVWIVKTIVEYRKWNRLSKVHVEVHNKLLDRFSNNEELLAYVQSPAGLRFLETAPRSLAFEGGDLNTPIRRILWAVQAGLVLAAGGAGLLIVSENVIEEIRQPLFAIGAVVLSLGIGFVVSAVVSYVLTLRMGLLRPASPRT